MCYFDLLDILYCTTFCYMSNTHVYHIIQSVASVRLGIQWWLYTVCCHFCSLSSIIYCTMLVPFRTTGRGLSVRMMAAHAASSIFISAGKFTTYTQVCDVDLPLRLSTERQTHLTKKRYHSSFVEADLCLFLPHLKRRPYTLAAPLRSVVHAVGLHGAALGHVHCLVGRRFVCARCRGRHYMPHLQHRGIVL